MFTRTAVAAALVAAASAFSPAPAVLNAQVIFGLQNSPARFWPARSMCVALCVLSEDE